MRNNNTISNIPKEFLFNFNISNYTPLNTIPKTTQYINKDLVDSIILIELYGSKNPTPNLFPKKLIGNYKNATKVPTYTIKITHNNKILTFKLTLEDESKKYNDAIRIINSTTNEGTTTIKFSIHKLTKDNNNIQSDYNLNSYYNLKIFATDRKNNKNLVFSSTYFELYSYNSYKENVDNTQRIILEHIKNTSNKRKTNPNTSANQQGRNVKPKLTLPSSFIESVSSNIPCNIPCNKVVPNPKLTFPGSFIKNIKPNVRSNILCNVYKILYNQKNKVNFNKFDQIFTNLISKLPPLNASIENSNTTNSTTLLDDFFNNTLPKYSLLDTSLDDNNLHKEMSISPQDTNNDDSSKKQKKPRNN